MCDNFFIPKFECDVHSFFVHCYLKGYRKRKYVKILYILNNNDDNKNNNNIQE